MLTPADIIVVAKRIAVKYRDEYNLSLTLRQMYYQFVSEGLVPNGDAVYKRIGSVLGKARLNGTFPISFLEDRGREVGSTQASEILTVNEGIRQVAADLSRQPFWLNYGRWYGQPIKVFVWVEKEALSGVLEPVCSELGVGLFPCKGYPSISALAGWVAETSRQLEVDEQAVIIYLGDHDPDGLQIPISAEATMRKIMAVEDQWFDFSVERIALTRAQIDKYDPPPMVAKKTSARYKRYKRETGLDEAWELDALDPPVLQKITRAAISRHFDQRTHEVNEADAGSKRIELIDRICDDPDWIEQQLRRNV